MGTWPTRYAYSKKLKNRPGITTHIAVSVYQRDQNYCFQAYNAIKNVFGDIWIRFFDSESSGCWIHPAHPNELELGDIL